ncbi:RNA polymerase sigma factor [candidate division KSB1 bacterium]|nr:RNA polymerase sigma factor [candidate division KSB1 bacterium]
MDNPNLEDLLIACRQGSDDAFRKLFEQYHMRVMSTAYRMCGNIQEAEDVTQDVFLKAFKEIKKFREAASLFTWLYRITINLCIDKERKRQRRQKYHENVDVDSERITIEEANSNENTRTLDQQMWQDEIQSILQKALSRIKPKFRTVLVLKDIEGLSYEEAAQAVGCSQGTISSRLNRGRKELKTLLVKMGMGEEYFQER